MTGTCSLYFFREGAGNGAVIFRSCAVISCLFSLFLGVAMPAKADGESLPVSGTVDVDDAVASCVDDQANHAEIVSWDKEGVFQDGEGRSFIATDLLALTTGAERAPSAIRLSAKSGTRLTAVAIDEPNRWGLIPSWIVMQNGEDADLLQVQILKDGGAIFAPDRASPSCADLLRSAEEFARKSHAGIWQGQAGAGVFQTSAPKSFDGRAGQYVIARGRIVSLGKTRSTRYLNFGRHWKSDLTVTLKSSDEDRFNEALALSGWQIEDLAGHVVEVRGVLQEKDGPYIALRHPEQLVVLERRRAKRGGRYSN